MIELSQATLCCEDVKSVKSSVLAKMFSTLVAQIVPAKIRSNSTVPRDGSIYVHRYWTIWQIWVLLIFSGTYWLPNNQNIHTLENIDTFYEKKRKKKNIDTNSNSIIILLLYVIILLLS